MPDGSPGAFSASNPAEIQKLSIRQAYPWCCSRLNVAGLFDGITDVGVRSQGAQFGLGFFRNFQGLHEILDDFRAHGFAAGQVLEFFVGNRKSTRLNSSHVRISYAVFCLKKKKYIYN